MNSVSELWAKVPPTVKAWLKGAEVAILTAVVTAAMAFPAADFTTKARIWKFIGICAASAGGALRLYLSQSPIQSVVSETLAVKQTATETTVDATKITQ
jgi:hypothetical protein